MLIFTVKKHNCYPYFEHHRYGMLSNSEVFILEYVVSLISSMSLLSKLRKEKSVCSKSALGCWKASELASFVGAVYVTLSNEMKLFVLFHSLFSLRLFWVRYERWLQSMKREERYIVWKRQHHKHIVALCGVVGCSWWEKILYLLEICEDFHAMETNRY